jgi:TonB family protein
MVTPFRFGIVALLLLASPTAIAARSSENPIVVELSAPTKAHWVQRISEDLSTRLNYPVSIGRPADEGIVTIAFRCGRDGRPTEILVPGSSGNAKLDAAAQLAVAQLNSLHPLPSDFAADQLFLARIAFATDERRMLRLLARASNAPSAATAAGAGRSVMIRVARRN